MNTSLRSLVIALLFASAAFAQTPPRIPGVSEQMRKFIAANEISGAVTLVATRDKILHLDAVGLSDIAAKKPMAADSICCIASMTKPITATAVLMLQDEGKLSIEDPVSKYIPEMANLKTADGKPARVTIRHLLTHTSGMAEASSEQMHAARTLSDLIPIYASKPLNFAPGSKWSYCQSAINTAGRIVEIVSGLSFDQFLQKRLFEPLGMKDSAFYLSAEQATRLATMYKRSADGKLEETPIGLLYGNAPTFRDRYPAPNGGLFSTAPDYARFCQMLLNQGSLDGKQYLKPETVKLMTTIQTGDLKTGFTEGNGWGIGVCIVRQPQGVSAPLSPGTFGHGGAYGTQAWTDPARGLIYILMVQRANFPNSDNSDVRKAFQDTAAGAITTSR